LLAKAVGSMSANGPEGPQPYAVGLHTCTSTDYAAQGVSCQTSLTKSMGVMQALSSIA